MASTKTLTAQNLEMLGAPRLAALLIELSTGDAAAKRRLRLELAGRAGADEAARAIGKRLASILKSRTFIDWRKAKSFVADLEAQHRAILDHVAPSDPRTALALLWRLMQCVNPVLARTSDSGGRVMAVFEAAARDLAPLARAAKATPTALARSVFEAMRENDYGQFDGLIDSLAPELGTEGLEHVRALGLAWLAEPALTPPSAEREIVDWDVFSHPVYADQLDRADRLDRATVLLEKVADALGDVDAYIALQEDDATHPITAAEIAHRLVKAGRAEEAWSTLEAVGPMGHPSIDGSYEQARIATLEVLGRTDEAQAQRWASFAATLGVADLRAYLRKLPEFEDFDAEHRAMAHALAFPDVQRALAFLVEWPAHDRAAQLVIDRAGEFKGESFELLAPTADTLEAKYPLAATVLRRAMIDFTLSHSRSTRYKHAARHLAECARLAPLIDDFGGWPDHAAYVASLRSAYARKWTFWEELDAL